MTTRHYKLISRTTRRLAGLAVGLALFAQAGALFAAEPAANVAGDDARFRDRINTILTDAWKEAAVQPAARATDAEFMRRAYLDLTGRIPRVSEARAYLDNQSPDKRDRLIDELLAEPGHPSHLADVWCHFLLPDTAQVDNAAGSDAFESWLRSRFGENRPYDEVVRELLLASGRPDESGPVLFYTSLELKPEKVAASTSRAFLGIQIQCAECHNHPFDKWTQNDFWGYAAFFARISPTAQQNGAMAAPGVRDQATGEVMIPNGKETIPPRFLLGDAAGNDDKRTRRAMLAEWMTSPQNPYFAKAAVNRMWALLFGRGLVDPPDDMSDRNPPRLANLLNELSDHFIRTNYDVRRMLKILASTDAYQLASEQDEKNERPADMFASMQLKMLTAEQLYSCVAVATCRPFDAVLSSVPSSMARRAMTNRTSFVNRFQAPSGRPTEYRAGIPQALMLLNGKLVDDATDLQRSDILVSLQAPFFTDDERIETLFLATLSREPSPEMREKFEGYVAAHQSADAKRKALGDVLWALLNSAEFSMNH